MKNIFYFLIAITILTSCTKNEEPIQITSANFHETVDLVSEIMVHDIFSPPVASRVFAYPNIAAYEIIAQKENSYTSLSNQISEFTEIPKADATKNINLKVAALVAHIELSKRLIFSENIMEAYRDSLYTIWNATNSDEFEVSKSYGLEVVEHIFNWMDTDNYKQTRTMVKFTVKTEDPSRWQPTPPSYMDGIEPHWSKIRTIAIDSAAQFKPIPPPAFSMEKDSDFYKELKEVYDISNDITESGDESEEVAIAQFWDCNPFVSVTRGHLMFATKKISPGAHWIGICKIACKKEATDFEGTVYAYTKTSIALFDAFISCWDEKYRSNLIRPETLINEHIDENWKPILQTPPFPEYVSGHSVASGAAAVALTDIFGDDFTFDDDTEIIYGLPIRSFKSFNAAADEAAISRMYGGIHYRAAVEVGVKQGREIGNYIVKNIKMKN